MLKEKLKIYFFEGSKHIEKIKKIDKNGNFSNVFMYENIKDIK